MKYSGNINKYGEYKKNIEQNDAINSHCSNFSYLPLKNAFFFKYCGGIVISSNKLEELVEEWLEQSADEM
jgi:hypothetical protein